MILCFNDAGDGANSSFTSLERLPVDNIKQASRHSIDQILCLQVHQSAQSSIPAIRRFACHVSFLSFLSFPSCLVLPPPRRLPGFTLSLSMASTA